MNQTSTLHSSATGRAVASVHAAAPADSLLLTAPEAAALFRVSLRLWHTLRKDLPPPVVLAKRAVRWRRSDLARHIDGLHAETEARPEPAQLAAGKARKRGTAGDSAVDSCSPNAESEAGRGSRLKPVPSNPKSEVSA